MPQRKQLLDRVCFGGIRGSLSRESCQDSRTRPMKKQPAICKILDSLGLIELPLALLVVEAEIMPAPEELETIYSIFKIFGESTSVLVQW